MAEEADKNSQGFKGGGWSGRVVCSLVFRISNDGKVRELTVLTEYSTSIIALF